VYEAKTHKHSASVNNSETENSKAENSKTENSEEFSYDEAIENKNAASIIARLRIVARNYYNDDKEKDSTSVKQQKKYLHCIPFGNKKKTTEASEIELYNNAEEEVNEAIKNLINQVTTHAIPIFEACFPECQALFAFNNAKSHATFAPDALIAKNMNLSFARKQAKMHSTSYFHEKIKYDQCMVFLLDYSIPKFRRKAKELK
ncbi:36647_t:CDS:2, partial [Gigaspora margarita]